MYNQQIQKKIKQNNLTSFKAYRCQMIAAGHISLLLSPSDRAKLSICKTTIANGEICAGRKRQPIIG